MGEEHVADDARLQQPSELHRERLVVVVLADEHHAPRPISRCDDVLIVGSGRKRGFLHEHVLACFQRAQSELAMKPRRNGDNDGIDMRIVDGGDVIGVRRSAAVPPAIVFCLRAVAACIRAHEMRSQPPKMAAMDAGDEAATEKREMQGFRHEANP